MTREEYQDRIAYAKEIFAMDEDMAGYYSNLSSLAFAYIDDLEAENASIKKALEKAAKSLYKSTQSCPSDMFDWEHPATCDIECNTHIHVDDAWKCWLDWLMGAK